MTTTEIAATNHYELPRMPATPNMQVLNPTDMTELGSLLTAAGLSTVAARNVVDRIQRLAMQVALATVPDLLEDLRKVNELRMGELERDIRVLPNRFGHVERDRVLQAIRVATSRSASI